MKNILNKFLAPIKRKKKKEVGLCIHSVTRHRPYIDRLVQEELAKQRRENFVPRSYRIIED